MATPRVAVAVSGGRDSTALLHCTVRTAAALGVGVVALHVHHGLMPAADAWLAQVQAQCRRWGVAFCSRRLQTHPPRGASVEAWARAERYRALAEMAREARCSIVLLAHHRRDQAETWLLQALRGGGPAGLSAMPQEAVREGITWARPWLAQPRAAIEAYVRRHRLKHVEDDSNADPVMRAVGCAARSGRRCCGHSRMPKRAWAELRHAHRKPQRWPWRWLPPICRRCDRARHWTSRPGWR